jgi:transcriptional antiterminator NusG
MDEPNNTIPQNPELPPEAEIPSASGCLPEGSAPSEPLPLDETGAPLAPLPVAQEREAAGSAPEPVAEPAMPEPVVELAVEPAAAEPVSEVRAEPVAKPAAVPAEKAERKGRRKAKEVAAEPEGPQEPKSDKLNWYILKVQSNREESIREGLQRRVKIAGLDRYFGDVIVPTEMVTEFKGGKKRVVKRKLYPGYLVVQMEINEETWFLVRETPGIGDFTGAAGHPTPMLPHEIARIIARQEEKSEEAPKLKISFNTGDRVKINEGTFENFEGEVDSIDQTNGRVTVMINIFGRSTPVELEYWQVEAI